MINWNGKKGGQKCLGPLSALIEHESEEQMRKYGLPKRVQVLPSIVIDVVQSLSLV